MPDDDQVVLALSEVGTKLAQRLEAVDALDLDPLDAVRERAQVFETWFAEMRMLPPGDVLAGLKHPMLLSVMTQEGIPAGERDDAVRRALQLAAAATEPVPGVGPRTAARALAAMISGLDVAAGHRPVHVLTCDPKAIGISPDSAILYDHGIFEVAVGDIDAANHLVEVVLAPDASQESVEAAMRELPALFDEITERCAPGQSVAVVLRAPMPVGALPSEWAGTQLAERVAARQALGTSETSRTRWRWVLRPQPATPP